MGTNNNIPLSKYRQIIQWITDSIADGILKQGDILPSINMVCKEWGLSRDTVLNAYYELKAMGIINSQPGKAYYVCNTQIKQTQRIFLLFDELNAFKEALYNTFLKSLDNETRVEIFFHHFNRAVFNNLLLSNNRHYTTYVIMPAGFSDIKDTLDKLSGKVIILDQMPPELCGLYPAVYQNFELDTYRALLCGIDLIRKYNKFIMIHPGRKEPEGQHKGFVRFCKEFNLTYELVNSTADISINRGDAYIAIDDNDLVWLIKQARQKSFKPGSDIGIVSYNDTPLKEVVAEGITTISTDFNKMGQILAQLISGKGNIQIENPSTLLIRKSL